MQGKMTVPVTIALVLAVVLVVVLSQSPLTTIVQASEQAVTVDRAFKVEFYVMAVIFAGVVTFFFYSIIVWRKKSDNDEVLPYSGNVPLEIIWTLIPLAIVLWISAYTAGELNKMTNFHQYDTAGAELVVDVTASQGWTWQFKYPTGTDADGNTQFGAASDVLYLPKGKLVLFNLHTTPGSMIHSFWIPEFRIKQDVVPGRTTHLLITPSMTPAEAGQSQFTVKCTELCGRNHYDMMAEVQVLEVADYEAWAAENGVQLSWVEPVVEATGDAGGGDTGDEGEDEDEENPLVAQGMALAEANGCTACHPTDSEEPGTGPSWVNLYGSEEEMADGSTVTVDHDYLVESITDPAAKVVAGFTPLMQPFDLSAEDLEAIIAYIQSLAGETD